MAKGQAWHKGFNPVRNNDPRNRPHDWPLSEKAFKRDYLNIDRETGSITWRKSWYKFKEGEPVPTFYDCFVDAEVIYFYGNPIYVRSLLGNSYHENQRIRQKRLLWNTVNQNEAA